MIDRIKEDDLGGRCQMNALLNFCRSNNNLAVKKRVTLCKWQPFYSVEGEVPCPGGGKEASTSSFPTCSRVLCPGDFNELTTRFYRTGTVNSNNSGNLSELAKKPRVRTAAQDALLDYFHSTRGLPFMDAENMSKNTPEFFDSLAKRVDIDETEVKRSLTRFLRYHPINEFEPFFESIGLKPYEYLPFVPRNMMFLSDDELLLENYYVLCNHGIKRDRIGKIYKEAIEIFRYEFGVLSSKLQYFHNLGINHTIVAKIIASSPRLLVGNLDQEFGQVFAKLKTAGIENDWCGEHISIEDSYDWKSMHKAMRLFSALGLNKEQIGQMCMQHPQLLLERSGRIILPLFGFLLKFGSTLADVQILFLQFPQISVAKFTSNLYRSLKCLMGVDMGVEDISWFVRSHPMLLGSCEPKSVKSLVTTLNCGKRKLCQMLKDDPFVLKKWTIGVRVERLQEAEHRVLKARMLKTKFLLSLGYVENSKEMETALKALRGRGAELNERFDCLMNSGLSREEVARMVRVSPRILNQSKGVLVTKIGFLVKDLLLPVSELVAYPKTLCYKTPRVKLRFSMYQWLKDKGAVQSTLALSTLLSSSEEEFMKTYVKTHPEGPEVWKKLKKEIESHYSY